MNDLKWRLADVLNKIKSSREFRKILLDNAESIVEEVYTFADNGCGSCKKKILRFIDDNVDTINKVIDEFSASDIPKVEEAPTPKSQTDNESNSDLRHKLPRQPVKVIGEVFEIEADPEAYKQFIKQGQEQRWTYRGLTVVQKSDKWIVFFY